MNNPEDYRSVSPPMLSSDSDLRDYVEKVALENEKEIARASIEEYQQRRDFYVEPLATDALIILLQAAYPDITIKQLGDRKVACWVPLCSGELNSVSTELSKLGYRITGLRNAEANNPAIEIQAIKHPSAMAQLRALTAAEPTAPELLDGWATVIGNAHKPEHKQTDTSEWALIRRVNEPVVQRHVDELQYKLENIGGIPGTQSAVGSGNPHHEG